MSYPYYASEVIPFLLFLTNMIAKYDLELIGYITTLENISGAKVKDAFIDKNGILVFIINQGEIAKAIGKKGINIKRLSMLLKKKVKLIEFNENVLEFIKNCIQPLQAVVTTQNEIITIEAPDTTTKAKLIGRDRQNLNALKELVNRHFKVDILIK